MTATLVVVCWRKVKLVWLDDSNTCGGVLEEDEIGVIG